MFSSTVSFWEALMIPCCSSNVLTTVCFWIQLKSKHIWGLYLGYNFVDGAPSQLNPLHGSTPMVSPSGQSGSDQILGTASQPEACRGGLGRGSGRQIQSWCFHTAAKDVAYYGYYVVCTSMDDFLVMFRTNQLEFLSSPISIPIDCNSALIETSNFFE